VYFFMCDDICDICEYRCVCFCALPIAVHMGRESERRLKVFIGTNALVMFVHYVADFGVCSLDECIYLGLHIYL
jgi:hypothetical protein